MVDKTEIISSMKWKIFSQIIISESEMKSNEKMKISITISTTMYLTLATLIQETHFLNKVPGAAAKTIEMPIK